MPQLFRVVDLQMGPRENEAMNRYYFDNPSGVVLDAGDVAVAFLSLFVDTIRLVQSTEWNHVAVWVEDLLDPANSILGNVTGGGGVVSSDPTPASNAWSFALKPAGPTIKRGAKRLPGVADSWADDEVVASGNPETAITAMAFLFQAALDVGGTLINHSIVRPNTPTNPTSYLVSTVVGAVYRQIGTQVSRKLSRGGGTSFGSFVPYRTSALNSVAHGALTDGDISTEIQTRMAAVTESDSYEATRSLV